MGSGGKRCAAVMRVDADADDGSRGLKGFFGFGSSKVCHYNMPYLDSGIYARHLHTMGFSIATIIRYVSFGGDTKYWSVVLALCVEYVLITSLFCMMGGYSQIGDGSA